MDSARYVIAVLVFITFPGAVLYWFLIHPMIGLWRRLGTPATLVIVLSVAVLTGVLFYRVRDTLLAIDFGTNYVLVGLAAISYAASAVLEFHSRKHLNFRILAGLPELAADGKGGALLVDGIYGVVRHPRYIGVVLGLLAVALFCNYLATYIMLPMMVVSLYLIVLLEERELRARFGTAYETYAATVPRFIPKLRGR